MAVIRTRLVVVGALLVLSGCQLGLIEQDAPGNPEDAAAAASDFLALLADGKADEAWAHMTHATRAAAYGGDREAFVADVSAADWSATQWEIGPVIDYEISWGVSVIVEGEMAPGFLIEKGVLSGANPREMQLLVQLTDTGYLIAGPGLDTEQGT